MQMFFPASVGEIANRELSVKTTLLRSGAGSDAREEYVSKRP
jgi:hypothetical protein